MALTTFNLSTLEQLSINSSTTGDQQDPTVAGAGTALGVVYKSGSDTGFLAGDFFETAVSFVSQGSNGNVARTPGSALTANQVNGEPSMARLPNGDYVVVWDEDSPALIGVRAVILNPDGSQKTGAQVLLGISAAGVNNPQVVALDDGNFAVAYDAVGLFSGLETYGPDLAPVGGAFTPFNTPQNQNILAPQLATNGRDLVLVGRIEGSGAAPSDSLSVHFFANGDLSAPQSSTVFPAFHPDLKFDVAMMQNGNVVLVHEERGLRADDNTISLVIQQPDGTRINKVNLVPNVSNTPNTDPQVAVLDNDFIVVAWQRDFSTESDIAFKVFDAAGNLVTLDGQGTQIAVQNSFADESEPAIVALGAGRFALVWRDSAGDGNGDRIDARIYDITSQITADDPEGETVRGDGLRNLITGSAADDALFGRGGDDTLFGGDDTDILNGGTGADELNGGDGFDYADHRESTGPVRASLANPDTNTGEAAGDTYNSIEALVGGDFNDDLEGDDAANGLYGFDGNDTLAGSDFSETEPGIRPTGDGAVDVLTGGFGDDFLIVSIADGDTVIETADGGTDRVRAMGAPGDTYTLPDHVEQLELFRISGGGQEGFLTGIGNALDNLILSATSEPVDIDGAAGNDTLVGSAQADKLAGGLGNDELRGEGGTDLLEGGPGDDRIFGGAGDDFLMRFQTLNSFVGNPPGLLDINGDLLNTEADRMEGGPGNDTYEIDSPNDVVIEAEGEGSDQLFVHLDSFNMNDTPFVENIYMLGSPLADKTVTGNALGNAMIVAGGNTTLTGGAGDDQLYGSAGIFYADGVDPGRDVLNGGDGDRDVAVYLFARAGVTASLADATQNTGDAAGDTFFLIEGLIGTNFDDRLIGNAGNNILAGFGGANIFEPGGGTDTVTGGPDTDMVSFFDYDQGVSLALADTLGIAIATSGVHTVAIFDVENVTGSIFGDFITGNADDNRIRGLGDYDFFTGSAGNDFYDGGTGRDMISYVNAEAAVTVDLGAGRGLAGQAAGDRYVSVERVTGSIHADLIFGGDEEEDFRGLGGYDTFVGSGGGKDRYDGGSGLDTVNYFNSTSGVVASLLLGRGSAGDAARDLYTSIENLGGTSYNDVLTGDNGRNNLRGLFGEDVLIGNGGNDYITGGKGNDTIFGGDGSDFAVFDGDAAEYRITRTANRDAVVQFIGAGRGDGTDSLFSVENFIFDDVTISIFDL